MEPVKEVTEWVNSFAIVEMKVPADSNTEIKDHSSQKKLRICRDPCDFDRDYWTVVSHPDFSKSTTAPVFMIFMVFMAFDIGSGLANNRFPKT